MGWMYAHFCELQGLEFPILQNKPTSVQLFCTDAKYLLKAKDRSFDSRRSLTAEK